MPTVAGVISKSQGAWQAGWKKARLIGFAENPEPPYSISGNSPERTLATTSPASYGVVAKIFHWLIVFLMIVQFKYAWTMPHIGRNTVPEELINAHFSVGMLMLIVVVLRLMWRVFHPVPARLDTSPVWEHRAAQLMHGVLYLLLLVIPILGWASASGRGFQVSLFGYMTFPDMVLTKGSPYAGKVGDIHVLLSTWVLLTLIGLHALMALWHHFVRRDATLKRMIWR